MNAGTHRINVTELIYGEPSISIGEGYGEIIRNGLCYFDISVSTLTYFSITSRTWNITKFSNIYANNSLAKVKKEIKCENNYLLDTGTVNTPLTYAQDTANRLLNHYSKPNTLDTEFILTNEKTGSWCLIKNKYGNQTKGNILRMDIDLTGGFIAKAKLVCVEDLSNLEYDYVCGVDDLYAGETNNDNIGLI